MKICSIDGCDKKAAARTWCHAHYQRWRFKGSPTSMKRGENGSGCVTQSGYKLLYLDGAPIFEHRHIMEVALGRALCGDEIVHHRNGDKLDNRIENVELMTRGEHAREHHQKNTATQKYCPNCQTIKPVEAFALSRHHSGGRFSYCRPCKKIVRRKYQRKSRAKMRTANGQ